MPSGPILDPCGNSQPQVLTNSTGIITSPNYPQTYGYDKYCSWLIKTEEDYVIELTFDFFSLAYPYGVLILWIFLNIRLTLAWLIVSNIFILSTSNDLLAVNYGNNTDLGRQFQVSGDSMTEQVHYSIYNEMFITFTADESKSATGFNLSYRIGSYILWH